MNKSLTTNNNLSDFAVAISEDAHAQRKDALEMSASVVAVVDEPALADCIAAASMLKSLQKGIDAAYKETKAPILAATKRLDEIRHGFNDALELEENRLNRLATDYVTERDRAAKAARDAELALIAAETAQEAHGGSVERLQELAQRRNELTVKTTVEGARAVEKWDYEVLNLPALWTVRPDLVEMTPRRAMILAAIQGGINLPGLRIFQEVKVTAKA